MSQEFRVDFNLTEVLSVLRREDSWSWVARSLRTSNPLRYFVRRVYLHIKVYYGSLIHLQCSVIIHAYVSPSRRISPKLVGSILDASRSWLNYNFLLKWQQSFYSSLKHFMCIDQVASVHLKSSKLSSAMFLHSYCAVPVGLRRNFSWHSLDSFWEKHTVEDRSQKQWYLCIQQNIPGRRQFHQRRCPMMFQSLKWLWFIWKVS